MEPEGGRVSETLISSADPDFASPKKVMRPATFLAVLTRGPDEVVVEDVG